MNKTLNNAETHHVLYTVLYAVASTELHYETQEK